MSESGTNPLAGLGTELAARAATALGEPLTGLLAHAYQLANDDSLSPDARSAAQNIQVAAETALAAQRELAVLGGAYRPQLAAVELGPLVETAIGSAQERSHLRWRIGPETAATPLWAMADATLLAQTCGLLLRRQTRGLAGATGEVRLQAVEAAPAGGPPGSFACLRFASERSRGVPATLSTKEDTLEEIFCSAVAALHGGAFSRGDGDGASRELLLPLCLAPSPRVGRVAAESGTILLIDDDAPFREAMKLALQNAGYRVLQAATGNQALETWQWHAPRIRLVVTDLTLDGSINGLDIGRKVLADRPRTPVLFASGSASSLVEEAGLEGAVAFLQKPFTPHQLLHAIRNLLEPRTDQSS